MLCLPTTLIIDVFLHLYSNINIYFIFTEWFSATLLLTYISNLALQWAAVTMKSAERRDPPQKCVSVRERIKQWHRIQVTWYYYKTYRTNIFTIVSILLLFKQWSAHETVCNRPFESISYFSLKMFTMHSSLAGRTERFFLKLSTHGCKWELGLILVRKTTALCFSMWHHYLHLVTNHLSIKGH